MQVSKKQLDIMKHAWGYDHEMAGYRNRYCTQVNDPDLNHLVQLGLMGGPVIGIYGEGNGIFYLTQQGVDMLFEMKCADLRTCMQTLGKTQKWLTRRVNLIKKAMDL